MAQPQVSIITASFNSARHLADCVKSVRSQTLDDWEHIIVDDGSTDTSVQLIEQLASTDSRIRVIRHETNCGPGEARNTAVAAAKGRYVAFLDADDEWLPDKLRRQVQLMRDGGWAFSYTDYAIIDDNGTALKESVNVPDRLDYTGLLKNTAIACLTVMVDTECIKDLKMPDMPSGQDYALWFRILRKGQVAYGINEVLARYRIVPKSVSRNKYRAARRMWTLYRDYEGLGVVRSSWYFLNYAVNAVRKYR